MARVLNTYVAFLILGVILMLSLIFMGRDSGVVNVAIATENDEIPDWQEIFRFVPNNVESCSELFGGNSNFSEDFMSKFENYKQQTPKATEGYTAKYAHAYKAYLTLAASPFVDTICETGFNAGHSTFGWLTVNPRAHVYSFDIGSHGYSKKMATYLYQLYPGRLNVTWGDSTKTLPVFHENNPQVKCDLIIIDGGHTYPVCKADFYNFMNMTNKNNIVILDNYPQRNKRQTLGDVWEVAKRKGELIETFSCDYERDIKSLMFGFSVGRYQIQRKAIP